MPYDAIGGIEGAIEQAAERALAGLGEIEIDALPRLLRELVVPVHQAAPSTAGSFALATRAATLVEAASDAAACRLADALVEARILLHEREHGAPTIRLAHHRVLERWRRAREIVAGNFDLFRIRDEIEEQRRRWQAGGRRAKMLLPRGLPLAQAEKVTAILGTELDDPVRGFVAASGRRARKRQRLVTSAAAVLAIVAAFAGWQYFEARTAQQAAEQSERMAVAERDRAIQQRQLAADGQKDAEQQRDIAQKGRERAEQQRQIAQDRQADAEQQRGIAQKRQEEAEAHRLLAEIRRKEADAQRNQALVIQSRVLADLSDQKLKSGDDATAALLALEGLPDETSGIVRPLRPEPQVALTRAWRFQGDERIPREARILMGHAGAVRSCALSRDGLRAVTGSSDRTARVWDAQTGVTVVQLRGHSNEIFHVAFTADGGKIVTAADDGVRLWDATTGMQLAVIPEARSFVAMGENGRQVAASSAQNRVHLWDSNTEREVARTMGGAILDTRIGPEGARVLVAAAGNSIELHDPVGGNRLRIFRGHTNRISNAAISRDGQRIASIGDDQTARVWSAANAAQLASLSDPRIRRDVRIGLSPDGGLLVIPLDSGFRIYAIDGRRQVAELAIADGEPSTALFSPDGKLVITASRAQGDLPAPMTAKLWEATTGRQLAILQQAAETTCASFSQDGRQLLTGTSDGIARIWKFDRNSDPVPQIAAGMRGYDRDAAPAAAQALVELSKAHVPRCLTRAQREQAYLDIAPPAWCIEMGKWPYHTPAWKEWLVYKRDADPPRPDTPEWLPWSASRSAGQGDPRRPVK